MTKCMDVCKRGNDKLYPKNTMRRCYLYLSIGKPAINTLFTQIRFAVDFRIMRLQKVILISC